MNYVRSIQSRQLECWESAALLLFIFASFVTPWDAFSRFFLFFGLAPLVLIRCCRGNVAWGGLLVSSVGLVLLTAGMNLLAGVPLGDSLQALRWALSTGVFILSVYHCARCWQVSPRFYGRLILVMAGVIATFALAQYVWQSQYPARLTGYGFMSHPIVGPAGLFCLWGVGLTLIVAGRRLGVVDGWLLVISLAVLCPVLLLSQSRGPIISFAFYLFVLLTYTAAFANAKKQIAVVGSLVVIAALLGFLAVSSPLVESMIDRGASYRIDIFKSVFRNPPESLLMGIGSSADFSSSPAGIVLKRITGVNIEHPHNLFLSVYYQSGILALLVLLTLIGCLFFRIVLGSHPGELRFVAATLLVTVILLNMPDGARIVARPSSDWMYFWFPFAFLMGMFSGHHSKNTARQGRAVNYGDIGVAR